MIYFDNSSTTKIDENVLKAMNEISEKYYINLDSTYTKALEFKKIVDKKKEIFYERLKLNPKNFHFTSGGGEANNLALLSILRNEKSPHFIISAIEHSSVLETAKSLTNANLDILKVDSCASVDLEMLENLVKEDTKLVSIIAVNNEVGTIQNLEQISKIVHKKNPNTYIHYDFVQGLNHMEYDFSKIKVDILTISSHKIHGPKGIGAIYISDRVKYKKQIFGKNSYDSFIPRTMPNELIIGFLEAIKQFNKEDLIHIKNLKEYFLQKLSKIDDVCINSPENSINNILNFSILRTKSEVLLNYLSSHNIYVSMGSACMGNTQSHVLKAMNLKNECINSAIRVSFSKYNTIEEIDKFFEILNSFVSLVRKIK